MPKLYGRASAPNVQKILWLAEELGLAFDRVDIGGPFGGLSDPAYLAKNPNGAIPTVEVDGFVLWESNAILRYFARQYPESELYPSGQRSAAMADQWLEWQNSALGLRIKGLMMALNKPGTPPDAVAAAMQEVARSAAILDGHLAGSPYLAGDAFTIADIAVGIGIHRWLQAPIERPHLPSLQTWYGRIVARPSFQLVRSLPLK